MSLRYSTLAFLFTVVLFSCRLESLIDECDNTLFMSTASPLESSFVHLPYQTASKAYFINDRTGYELAYTIEREEELVGGEIICTVPCGEDATQAQEGRYIAETKDIVIQTFDINEVVPEELRFFKLSIATIRNLERPEEDIIADQLSLSQFVVGEDLQLQINILFFKVVDVREYPAAPSFETFIELDEYSVGDQVYNNVYRQVNNLALVDIHYHATEGILSFKDPAGDVWYLDRVE